MYATTSRTNRRVRSTRTARPVTACHSGGIQGLVLVRDTSRAGVWLLKPSKPQSAAYDAMQEIEAAREVEVASAEA
jgi:hypothetical protein